MSASLESDEGIREKRPTETHADSPPHDASPSDDVSKEVEDNYMTGIKLYILVFGLSLAVFLMALDMTILNVAIPSITEKFHSTADIGWYSSGYLSTLCSFQPLSGKLYSNFSLKWTFLMFFLIFEFGSTLSGAATSSAFLIGGRATSGVGAAGLMSGTLSIIAVVVPIHIRALYTGVLSSMFGIAMISGPLIGGALTQHVSWRWVFYINLPIGCVTIVALVFMFHPPTRKIERDPLPTKLKRLDLIGAAIFIPAIIMILMALQWGGATYPWSSSRIIGLFVGGGILIATFIGWQWYTGHSAMIPPAIFTQRTVFWACLCAAFGAQTITGLWLPEWFQVVKGDSPSTSGIHMLPSMLSQTVAALVSGIGITMLGYYNPFIIVGPALMSVAAGLITTLKVDSRSAEWIGYQIINGVGSGFFMTAPMIAVQTVLSPANTPVGIAIVSFFQMFGGALLAGLSQTIFNQRLPKELAKNVPGVDVAALLAAGTAAVRRVVLPEQLPAVLESYNGALLAPFYLSVGVTALSSFFALGLEWVDVKKKKKKKSVEAVA